MINFNQKPIQVKIEDNVTGGLGFRSQSKYIKEYSIFKKYLSEEEVKNTDNGLQAHLAEMDSDRIVYAYMLSRNKNFLGKIKGRLNYFREEMKLNNLKEDAINEAVKNCGGLLKLILKDKIKDTMFMLTLNN